MPVELVSVILSHPPRVAIEAAMVVSLKTMYPPNTQTIPVMTVKTTELAIPMLTVMILLKRSDGSS